MRAKALQSWASHSKRSTAAVTTMDIPPFNPDRDALKTVGARVRRRLARDPAVKPIKTDLAEIYAGPEFLEPDECDRLIEMVDAVAEPSTLYDQTDQQARTSYSGNFDRADPFVQMIERRIDDLLGMPNAWGETIQGQRYQPGQEFRHHCDWFRTDGTYWAQEEATGGQRSWTWQKAGRPTSTTSTWPSRRGAGRSSCGTTSDPTASPIRIRCIAARPP
jgi:hypothetical protein